MAKSNEVIQTIHFHNLVCFIAPKHTEVFIIVNCSVLYILTTERKNGIFSAILNKTKKENTKNEYISLFNLKVIKNNIYLSLSTTKKPNNRNYNTTNYLFIALTLPSLTVHPPSPSCVRGSHPHYTQWRAFLRLILITSFIFLQYTYITFSKAFLHVINAKW